MISTYDHTAPSISKSRGCDKTGSRTGDNIVAPHTIVRSVKRKLKKDATELTIRIGSVELPTVVIDISCVSLSLPFLMYE